MERELFFKKEIFDLTITFLKIGTNLTKLLQNYFLLVIQIYFGILKRGFFFLKYLL